MENPNVLAIRLVRSDLKRLFSSMILNHILKFNFKAHSCGIYLSPNESIAVKFAACAMKSRKYDEVDISFILFVGIFSLNHFTLTVCQKFRFGSK